MQTIDSLLTMISKYPTDELLQFSLGRAYARESRWPDAEAAFRKALELKPTYTTVYRELGRALEMLDRKDDARVIFQEGLKVAEQTGDLQVAKEITVFLSRL